MRAIAWLIVKLSGLFVKLYHLILNAIRRFDRAMRKRYRPKHLALMVVLVIAITASITLFVPPYLGLSNDGSFAAVLADTGLSRLDPSDTSAFFNYYERVYNVGSSALPTGTTPLVQRMLVRTAVVIDELVTHDGLFDMRFLAAIYLLIYILLLIPMLSKLLGRVKVYSEGLFIAVFAVLIFGDTAMITRFASFYTQPIELILMVALANCVLQIPDSLNRFLPQIGLAVTVILMMAVNQYCALMGVVFSVAYWMLMRHKADALHKGLYLLLAVLLCVVSVMQTGDMVNNQTVNEKYDQMTRGVLFEATDPEKALAQFGIEARYSVLTDTYSTQSYPVVLPESGALDEGFLDQYTTSDVTLYYLRHPIQLLGLFEVGVRNAFFTRTDYSGNYEQSSGMPARAKALFLSIWSTFKERSAPQTAASLLLLVVAFLFFRRKADEKLESGREAASVYTMLSVLLFAAVTVELMTVVILSGDSLLLRRQVDEQVLVDDVTELYNLRAMYRDAQMMTGYCVRNHLPISLMIIQMRYESELRGMLSHSRYIQLRKRLAELVMDSVRVEDKVYCIDEHGTMAILLTSNEANSAYVRSRIIEAVTKEDAFDGILERGTHMDLRFACKEYDEHFGKDMMAFKKAVESELAYDV